MLSRIFLSSLFLLATMTQAERSDKAVDLLAELLNGERVLQASFEQHTIDASNTKIQSQSGKLWAGPDLKLRLEIESPWASLVVSDGESLWNYDPDLEQATRENAKNTMGQSPAIILTGTVDEIVKRYEVSLEPSVDENFQIFSLEALSDDSQFEELSIEFVGELPVDIRVVDILGNTTLISLQRVAWLEESDEKFVFIAPDGTDIVDQWVP
jgi:outer membrane lipoprotein carrier protein